jgi:hypothetical protein
MRIIKEMLIPYKLYLQKRAMVNISNKEHDD